MSISIQRCYDVAVILGIIHNPVLWDNITDDGAEQFIPNVLEDVYLTAILVEDSGVNIIGLFRFDKSTNSTVNAHPCILPEYRSHGKEAGQLALVWLRDNMPDIHKVECTIPEIYKNVYHYAKNLGFIDEGFSRASYRKNDVLCGQFRAGMTRTELEQYTQGR